MNEQMKERIKEQKEQMQKNHTEIDELISKLAKKLFENEMLLAQSWEYYVPETDDPTDIEDLDISFARTRQGLEREFKKLLGQTD